MDEITITDLLEHYRLKFSILYERIDTLIADGKEVSSLLPEFWRGAAADAFDEKTAEAVSELRKANSELSDAQNILLQMKAALEASGII